MRRPSTYRAEKSGDDITMEKLVAAFLRASASQREAAYIRLTGQDEQERKVELEDLKVVTRPELAKLLKLNIRTIDYHRRAGHLTPVYIAGTKRARGYTAESVRALLRGDYANDNAEKQEVR